MGRLIPCLAALATLAMTLPVTGVGVRENAPHSKTEKDAPPEFIFSRYQLDDVDAYISRRTKAFAIQSLDIDPFGLPQDPSKKPIASQIIPNSGNKYTAPPPTPFVDVIAALHVNAVMPHQQRFLIGSRTFRRGDTFPIAFQNKSVKVKVLRIGGNKIDFRNTSTGETASLSLKLLPPGMNRDSGKASPPGLIRDNPGAPVEVQVNPPSSGASRVISKNR